MVTTATPCKSGRLVVVLVHGTFGSRAMWTQKKSPLRATLRTTLPAAAFTRHRWSGWNSHSARRKGAASLTRRLLSIAAKDPSLRIVLIAHSHGGHVAFHALKNQPVLSKAVVGVICMSTPFMHVRPGGLAATLFRNIPPFMVGAFLLCLSATLATFAGEFETWSGSLAVLVPSLIGAVGAIWLLRPSVNRTLADRPAELLKQYATPSQTTRVLVIRVPGDEALGLLRVWDALSRWLALPSTAVGRLTAIVGMAAYVGFHVLMAVAAVGLVVTLLGYQIPAPTVLVQGVQGLIAFAITGAVGWVLAMVLFGFLAPLFRGHPFSWGERLWTSLWVSSQNRCSATSS